MQIAQEAKATVDGWWTWAVWLEGEATELDAVESMTYYLHPTFLNPIQVRKSRSEKFRLEEESWGGFTLRARIAYPNGREEILRHTLRLEGAEERPPKVPTLFISHSLADAEFAETIRRTLKHDEHLDFAEPTPATPGLPLSVEDLIEDSDALIAIVSDKTGQWVERDIELAERLGVPVVPVVIGTAKLPAKLKSVQVISLDEIGEGNLARSLETAFSQKPALVE